MNAQQQSPAQSPQSSPSQQEGAPQGASDSLQDTAGNAFVQDLMNNALDPEVNQQAAADGDAVDDGVSKATKKKKVWLVSNPSRYKKTIITKLDKGVAVEVLDTGVDKPFNKVKKNKYKWWKVKVLTGTDSGKEGWVMPSTLTAKWKPVKKGDKEVNEKVDGGTVVVRVDASMKIGDRTYDEMFSISYQGKDADDAKWLQFIWREIVGIDEDGDADPLLESVTTTGGTYDLTDGGTWDSDGKPAQKNYNTDTASATNPFYEAGFVADRTADNTTIYDQPSPIKTKVSKLFADGSKKAVSRAHFHTFLIKGEDVKYKVDTDVEWKFNKADDNPKRDQSATGGSANALPATIAKRFHAQFPTYKNIK
jgi:hypothetical protein